MNNTSNDQIRFAVVTGADGEIGKSLCYSLAADGYCIYACILKSNPLFESDMHQLEETNHISVRIYYINQEDPESIELGINQILNDKTNIDVLFHCAGITATALLNKTSIDEIKRVYQINYFSLLQITKLITKRMIRKRHGNIISIASYAGVENKPGRIAYGGSKNAIIYATKTLANEYKPFGIRVNAIAPGPVDTNMIKHYSAEEKDSFISSTYDKRLGTIDDIVNLLMFLASEQSSHINGQIIRIDGGM